MKGAAIPVATTIDGLIPGVTMEQILPARFRLDQTSC